MRDPRITSQYASWDTNRRLQYSGSCQSIPLLPRFSHHLQWLTVEGNITAPGDITMPTSSPANPNLSSSDVLT